MGVGGEKVYTACYDGSTVCRSTDWSIWRIPSIHTSVEALIDAIKVSYVAPVDSHGLRPTLQTPISVQDDPPILPLLGHTHCQGGIPHRGPIGVVPLAIVGLAATSNVAGKDKVI